MTNITFSIDDEINKKMYKIFADEKLLRENWLSEEDNIAWKDL
jgi:hypothetical protein